MQAAAEADGSGFKEVTGGRCNEAGALRVCKGGGAATVLRLMCRRLVERTVFCVAAAVR
jgi:hypothetical protein